MQFPKPPPLRSFDGIYNWSSAEQAAKVAHLAKKAKEKSSAARKQQQPPKTDEENYRRLANHIALHGTRHPAFPHLKQHENLGERAFWGYYVKVGNDGSPELGTDGNPVLYYGENGPEKITVAVPKRLAKATATKEWTGLSADSTIKSAFDNFDKHMRSKYHFFKDEDWTFLNDWWDKDRKKLLEETQPAVVAKESSSLGSPPPTVSNTFTGPINSANFWLGVTSPHGK